MTQPRMLVQLAEDDLVSMIEMAVARALKSKQADKESMDHLTVREAAGVLRCGEHNVRRLVRKGLLENAGLTRGGSSRVLIPRASLEALLAKSAR